MSSLPRDSATVRSVVGEAARWGESEHLLATVIDVLQVSNDLFVSANSKKGARRSKVKPIPRPGREVPVDDDTIRGRSLPLDEMLEIQRRWARGELHDGR